MRSLGWQRIGCAAREELPGHWPAAAQPVRLPIDAYDVTATHELRTVPPLLGTGVTTLRPPGRASLSGTWQLALPADATRMEFLLRWCFSAVRTLAVQHAVAGGPCYRDLGLRVRRGRLSARASLPGVRLTLDLAGQSRQTLAEPPVACPGQAPRAAHFQEIHCHLDGSPLELRSFALVLQRPLRWVHGGAAEPHHAIAAAGTATLTLVPHAGPAYSSGGPLSARLRVATPTGGVTITLADAWPVRRRPQGPLTEPSVEQLVLAASLDTLSLTTD